MMDNKMVDQHNRGLCIIYYIIIYHIFGDLIIY